MFNFLLGVIFFLVYDVSAQENCNTPEGKIGACVLLSQCSSLVNILTSAVKNNQYDNAFESLLRAYDMCGYNENNFKLCCEKPNPPDVSNHKNLALLDHNSCGVFSGDKIFGGTQTGVFDFPWMALIAYESTHIEYLQFRCAGTIINKRYILTAAHCVTNLPSYLTVREVRVGEHDIDKLMDCDTYYNVQTQTLEQVCAEGFQDIPIKSIHPHSRYSTKTLQNDIALLKLKGDINFLPHNVRPICLPIGSAAQFYGDMGTVTGWGSTEFGPQSSVLLQVKIPLVPIEACIEKYSQQNISYKQMCAGGQTGLDSCSGDSGGPLQNTGNYYGQSRMVQYGIVSYGTKLCGTIGHPAIYTAVHYHMDWILNTME